MLKKILMTGVLALLATGCTTVTNLTPTEQPRSETGLYPFEIMFTTKAKVLAKDSIHPYVIIGDEQYEMQKTPLMADRWEALVPIPTSENAVNYQFKVNYQWKAIGGRRENSRLSDPYVLSISD